MSRANAKKDDKPAKPKKQTKRQAKVDKKSAKADAALQQKIDELTELVKRERADAENMRRRHENQVGDLKSYVKAEVVRELLPVIDNIDRALAHAPKDLADHDYVKGVQGVAKQLQTTLDKLGVSRIPTVDQPFDPELHEAVSMDEESEGSQEIVSEELQAGYRLGNHVIRHAMVRVKRA